MNTHYAFWFYLNHLRLFYVTQWFKQRFDGPLGAKVSFVMLFSLNIAAKSTYRQIFACVIYVNILS